MLQQSPGMLMLLFGFLVFPLIYGGKMKEKAAEMVASFVGAVFSSPVLFLIYFVVLLLFKIMFF